MLIGNSKKLTIALAVVIFALGALCVAYPYVSDYVNKLAQSQITSQQSAAVDGTAEQKLADERERAVTYNEQLLSGRTVVTDPFDPNREQLPTEDYLSVMNLSGDGVMGTLYIPKIHAKLPIYHGTADDVLQHGVGHLDSTSLPWGGESSHCVMAGHTGLPSVRIFDALGRVQKGDYFIIRSLGEDHAYRVYDVEVVLPQQTESLLIQPGQDLCTLVTCTPYGINSHRLLVHGQRCEVPQEWLDLQESGRSEAVVPTFMPGLTLFTLIGIALAVAIVLLVNHFIIGRKRGTVSGKHGGDARGLASAPDACSEAAAERDGDPDALVSGKHGSDARDLADTSASRDGAFAERAGESDGHDGAGRLNKG